MSHFREVWPAGTDTAEQTRSLQKPEMGLTTSQLPRAEAASVELLLPGGLRAILDPFIFTQMRVGVLSELSLGHSLL